MPLMRQNAVVPFGKYRGQPVEQLAADPEYCEWLMGQSWFVEKYQAIHTVIINNFGEPSETPEHNKLQLRFLNDAFRRQCTQAMLTQHGILAGALWKKIVQVQGIHDNRSFMKSVDELSLPKPFYRNPTLPEFEVAGIDVCWKIQEWQFNETHTTKTAYTDLGDRYYEEYYRNGRGMNDPATKDFHDTYGLFLKCNTIVTKYEWTISERTSVGIECKPVLGDDYPAVLRFMRNIRQRPSIYCLVIGALRSQVASLDQLRTVFAQAHIALLTVAEIEATALLPVWSEHELPNPLEDESFIASNS